MSTPQTVASTHWRDVYPVHPAAEVFPMMSEPEIDALAKDIKQQGLREPVQLYRDPTSKIPMVLDGRNRIEALTRAGIDLDSPPYPVFATVPPEVDPACYVISLNIHRRHLTKEQQAELIVKAIEAGRPTNDSAKVARSFSPSLGKRGGSTKDPVLRQAVEEGAKHEISARTIKRARAKVAGKVAAPRRKPATRPSAQPAKDARPHTPGDRVLPAPAPPPAIEPREPRIQGTAPKRPEGCRELAQRFIADVGRMVEPMIEDGHRAGAVEVVKDISCYTVAALNSLLERLHREDPERLAPPPAQSAGVA